LLLKSVCSFGFAILWWTALRRAPVGDCIAITYTSPVFTSILSTLILGEKLPPEFPLQAILCSAGIVLILDPPALHHLWSTTATNSEADYSPAFASLILCCLAPIVTRKTKGCSWIEVEHTNAVFAAVVLNPLAFGAQYFMYGTLSHIPHTSVTQVSLILLAAAGCFVGLAMETKGYQLAEAGRASMFRNAEVPFGYVLQHFGTDSPLSVKALAGSLCILASCGLGVIRETYMAEAEKVATSDKAEVLYKDVSNDDVESVGSTDKTSAGSVDDGKESVDFSDGSGYQQVGRLEQGMVS